MALQPILSDDPIARIFDFTTTYMDVPALPPEPTDYPYPLLADMARAARDLHSRDAIAYVPYLPSGWNPRPWGDPRASFQLPNRSEWTAELREMQRNLLDMPNLGFPLPDGGRQLSFTIYAWNEFGEGGFIAPTQRSEYMKIEEIRNVFAEGMTQYASGHS